MADLDAAALGARAEAMIQALAPVKKSSAFRLRIASGASWRIRRPAALQVTILSSSFRVITPFDMLSNMLSL